MVWREQRLNHIIIPKFIFNKTSHPSIRFKELPPAIKRQITEALIVTHAPVNKQKKRQITPAAHNIIGLH